MPSTSSPTIASSACLAPLCRARDLIRDCFTETITLEDCAMEAELSSWHLLRSFRAAFGETPKEFATRLRLEHARHLLTVTSRSVTDICFDVGFSSLGSFSTLFKRHYGYSPREFQRQARCWVTVPGKTPWAFIPFCYARRLAKSVR